MKYFFDTEFIEDGKTIDLISIGMVCEDGRKLYLQNSECTFLRASEWVWRNVFPHLEHFEMRGQRSCKPVTRYESCMPIGEDSKCSPDCPWRFKSEIKKSILEFCDIPRYGKPEFWGYYADYDWVEFCQLFGRMIDLPKGFPMYCCDIKQFCDSLGNPSLPEQGKNEHSAILDAQWNKDAYDFLVKYQESLRML